MKAERFHQVHLDEWIYIIVKCENSFLLYISNVQRIIYTAAVLKFLKESFIQSMNANDFHLVPHLQIQNQNLPINIYIQYQLEMSNESLELRNTDDLIPFQMLNRSVDYKMIFPPLYMQYRQKSFTELTSIDCFDPVSDVQWIQIVLECAYQFALSCLLEI